MKNYIKILPLLLFFNCAAYASPYGITCSKPVLTDVVRDAAPIPFSLTCTNGTPADFSNITFTAHQLGGAGSTVQVAPISKLPHGKTVTTTGTMVLQANGHYVFDFHVKYASATHDDVLCKGNPASSNCMAFDATDPSFVGLSDIHFDKDVAVTTPSSDTGVDLWHNTQVELNALIKTNKPKFILLLGDLPAHHKDSTLQENITQVLTDLSDTIHIPVYYVAGNNDSLGGDYNSFTNGSDASSITPLSLDPGKNWPTLNVNHSCAENPTAPCTLDTSSGIKFGYYSARPATGLRLIVLNSVIFSDRYPVNPDDGVSADDITIEQLNWLNNELDAARAAHESAIIAMHIPFGLDAYSNKPLWKSDATLKTFTAIIAAHEAIIKGVYTGHTHMDEFRRLYDDAKDLAVLDVSTPGITPNHGNNPALRMFSYDPNSLKLMDVATYYTTVAQSNVWHRYSFNQDYHCNTKNVFDCARDLSLNDPSFTNRYDINYSTRNPAFLPPPEPIGWQNIWHAIDIFA